MGNEWKKGGDTPDSEHPAPHESVTVMLQGSARGKLHCHNWLADVPGGMADDELVEVQFRIPAKDFSATPPISTLRSAIWWQWRPLGS